MKVLIAEDEKISKLLVERAVRPLEFEIIIVSDGQKAWEAYQAHTPGLVISDWMMPGLTGIELCRKIRAHKNLSYTYIILLTSRDSSQDLVTVFDAGADDYITKPFKPPELLSRVKSGHRIATLQNRHYDLQTRLVVKNKKLNKALKELSLTQAQMLQSEKMASVGQLAAGVAHEINNPIGFVGSNLGALTGYFKDFQRLLDQYRELARALAQPLEKGGLWQNQLQAIQAFEKQIDMDYLQEDIPDLLADCVDGIQRVGRIVADLRSFASPGDEKKKLMDINKGIESTLGILTNELKYKTTVNTSLSPLPPVAGYSQKINQVFMNILMNAVQSIEDKGVITIETQARKDRVRVSIQDTGCGIPRENLNKIFDPFFTTKPVGKGTGLGMNMVYNIMKEHGGNIQVKSREGEGTCFVLEFPAAGVDAGA